MNLFQRKPPFSSLDIFFRKIEETFNRKIDQFSTTKASYLQINSALICLEIPIFKLSNIAVEVETNKRTRDI